MLFSREEKIEGEYSEQHNMEKREMKNQMENKTFLVLLPFASRLLIPQLTKETPTPDFNLCPSSSIIACSSLTTRSLQATPRLLCFVMSRTQNLLNSKQGVLFQSFRLLLFIHLFILRYCSSVHSIAGLCVAR